MAAIIPTSEPTSLIAGATWQWTITSATYPLSEGWALSYTFPGPSAFTWSAGWATDDGATTTITIPAATTAILTGGTYRPVRIWTGSGAYNGEVRYEEVGAIVVQDNPTRQSGVLSASERNLNAIVCALEARYRGDVPEEYTIGGRSVKKMSIEDLERQRTRYQAEVNALRSPTSTRRVLRFVAPSP